MKPKCQYQEWKFETITKLAEDRLIKSNFYFETKWQHIDYELKILKHHCLIGCVIIYLTS